MSNIMDLMTVSAADYKNRYSSILGEVQNFYESEYNGKVSLTDTDIYAIGKYTDTVDKYLPFIESGSDNSGLGDLKDAMRSSLGLSATQYATSVVPLLASVQPTDQEVAILYYKEAVATETRGGVTTGDKVLSRFGSVNKNMDSYISDQQINNSVKFQESGNSAGFIIKLLAPVRPSSVNITLEGKVTAIDNGEGAIFGSYIDPTASSINYETGELKIKLQGHSSLSLTDDKPFEVAYSQLVFNNDAIAGFKYQIKSEATNVRYYPLQTTYDAVNNFVTKRQFGQAISDFANKDLIYQINKAISGEMIKQMKAAAIKNEAISSSALTWSQTAPTGVSLIDHRRTFSDIYDLAIQGMEKFTGLGGVTAVVVGAEGRKIYNALGIGSTKSKPGAYVLGFDGDICIIYASSDYLDADEVLLIHKGDYFETAAIYCPFLPVMTIETQGRDHNVFQKTVGAATAAAMKVVNPGFVQRVKLTK